MADSGEEHHGLSKLVEDGLLPQLVAGPAGKAICRLIGAGVDIPVAYLESVSQGIRDKTKARSTVSKAMAQQVAARAVENPAIMDRAMTNMVARAYRVQENKEAIARVAVENLRDDPPPPDSDGPSDDWMSKLEHYAEDATDDNIRDMFGKLLANEIRKSGAISKMTLHFVSMLDSETAKLIDRAFSACMDGKMVITESITPPLSVFEISNLTQCGFWDTTITHQLKFDNNGNCIQRYGVGEDNGFYIRGKKNKTIILNSAALSKSGRDILRIVHRNFDIQSFANIVLNKRGVTNFFVGKVVMGDHKISILSLKELHKKS